MTEVEIRENAAMLRLQTLQGLYEIACYFGGIAERDAVLAEIERFYRTEGK